MANEREKTPIDLGKQVLVEVFTQFGPEPIVFDCGTVGDLFASDAMEQLAAEEISGAGLAAKSNRVAAMKNFAVRVVKSVSGIEPAPDCAQVGKLDAKTGIISGSWADGMWYPALELLVEKLRTVATPRAPILGEPEKNG